MPKLTRKPIKSSVEARRLIRAYIKHYGNEREAAKHLHMTHGQLNALKVGRIKDTPAIQAAIKRADARAKYAWLHPWKFEERRRWIDDQATLKEIKRNHERNGVMIDLLIEGNE
jgi:hypothetical protein